MKTGTKLLIALLAVAITFVGFNLMVSSNAVELSKAGIKPVCEVVYDEGSWPQVSFHYFLQVLG